MSKQDFDRAREEYRKLQPVREQAARAWRQAVLQGRQFSPARTRPHSPNADL